MKTPATVLCAATLLAASPHASTPALLFIGNSFTFGAGSPVQTWRPQIVTDLNHEGIGGVPALFKEFTSEAGLDYDVSLETHPGAGLDYHLQNRRDVLAARPWDVVVMHGYSTLDSARPGDPAKLVDTTREMAEFLVGRNPNVAIHLTATWSRADQTYPGTGHWYGRPIAAMAADVQAGYEKAAKTSAAIKSVIPVGHAWIRAIETGVADPNPYDGITPGQIDLWAKDHYHASTQGYYLEALMVFGDVTGRDPRSLGEAECSAFELGMPRAEVRALQQVAFDELASGNKVTPARNVPTTGAPAGCAPAAPRAQMTSKIVMLGTGTPRMNPDRSGPATAIVVGDRPYLIDLGPGVVRRAAQAARKLPALEPTNISVAFLTHLHSDHTAGYPDLMLMPWVFGRKALDVYGPNGTEEMTEYLLKAYHQDIEIRTRGMERRGPLVVRAHDVKPGVVFKDDRVTVKAFRVPHGEWPQAFGYRFETPDRVIVISGDTSPGDEIVANCRPCDVLIHEVQLSDVNLPSMPDWPAYRARYHTTTEQLADLATRAKPGLLIAYHNGAAEDGIREILRRLQQSYTGKVAVARDLDVF